jgi:hypothetical protein
MQVPAAVPTPHNGFRFVSRPPSVPDGSGVTLVGSPWLPPLPPVALLPFGPERLSGFADEHPPASTQAKLAKSAPTVKSLDVLMP